MPLSKLSYIVPVWRSIPTDETPTPVRLLRNCEEVGLFDDLKHVNPFDETFRQAIYSQDKPSTTSSLPHKSLDVLVTNDEDTLHTPKIRAQIEANAERIGAPVECNVMAQSEAIDCSGPSKKQANSKRRRVIVPKQEQPPHSEDTKVWRKIYPKPHITTAIAAQPHHPESIKDHIKDSLLKLRTTSAGGSAISPAQMNPSNGSEDARSFIARQPATKKVSKIKVEASKADDVTERNREAAKRYRHKHKAQHEHLTRRNALLEAENAQLRKELQLMRELHRNCVIPITIQRQGGKT